MAILYLIRHGQASFGMANYDELSEIGRKQSSFLPRHFEAAGKREVDFVYAGTMQRHKQTAEFSFGLAKVRELPGLNEFDHEDILRVHRPEVVDNKNILIEKGGRADARTFIRTEFQQAILKWVQRKDENNLYKESFEHFKSRCIVTLQQMVTTARKEQMKDVVAITSGGFISFIITYILQMPETKFAEVNLNIANTAVSSFLFNDEKVSLGYFNNYSHLPKELVTFR